MSRLINDHDLLTWEIYPSGGPFGFPDRANLIFQCLSDPDRRSRFVPHDGDTASVERHMRQLSDEDLRLLLQRSVELD